MKKILFATGNPSKAKRFNKYFDENTKVISLKDLNIKLDVNENGSNAIENALIKARAGHKASSLITIGMDDTLYLENVPDDIQPGMFVRRVGGKELSDEEMLEHYTSLVKKYGKNGKLNAKWVYGLALIDKSGNEFTYTWEKNNFYLVSKPSETVKPGYPLTSISKYKLLDKYFEDLTEEEEKLIYVSEKHVADFIISHLD